MRLLVRGVVLTAALTVVLAPPAAAKTLCVAHGSGCFRAIQPAVDAAHDGDVVRVGPGTFPGGVKLGRSVRLQVSGADATRIAGGGPVLTLGTLGAASEPIISVDGVTITRGKTTSGPDGAFRALGGGIFIPRRRRLRARCERDDHRQRHRGQRGGAVIDVAVAEPSALPGRRLPYAEADGGGIDNAGTLTVDRVVVADNRADGPVTSDADGAGIYSHRG